MREGQETILAVVCSHTRIANATKGHLVVDNMHDHIVHARTTRGGVTQDIIALLAKIIQSQRTLALVDKLGHRLRRFQRPDPVFLPPSQEADACQRHFPVLVDAVFSAPRGAPWLFSLPSNGES